MGVVYREGNVIGNSRSSSVSAANGLWNLYELESRRRNNIWPGQIVNSGLVLHLDAGNPTSYPGSGTTWTDLSGNGRNGTLTNGPTYDSSNRGSLVFDGVDDTVNFTYDLRSTWTYECWALHNALTGFAFLGQGSQVTRSGLHIVYLSGGSTLRFGMYANDTDALSLTTSTGVWYNYCFTYNHSTFLKQIYRNGVQLTGTPLQTQTSYIGTGTARIGATYGSPGAGTNNANGRISIARLYSSILSPAEVLQNFNASRDRYGI